MCKTLSSCLTRNLLGKLALVPILQRKELRRKMFVVSSSSPRFTFVATGSGGGKISGLSDLWMLLCPPHLKVWVCGCEDGNREIYKAKEAHFPLPVNQGSCALHSISLQGRVVLSGGGHA